MVALILSSTALTPLRAKAAELPTGADVAAGQVSIATGGSTMLIDQSSQNAIINWDSFSVGNGGMVTFQNGSGATLNRVTGTGLSSIDGTLKATGSLFLVNQNGIVIGKDGVVQTGGKFVASTLDIQDSDFLDGGDMTFAGSSAASVTNLGKVGSLGGDIAFIARHIVNEGDVSAPNGTVGLAAGREILMRDASLDDGMFLVKVGDTDSSITEAGVITAATVELRTHGGNIYALAGNKGGAINATGVSTSGGRIFLTAGGGKVHVAKKVRATRQVSGKRSGGDIFMNADVVNIAGLLMADGEAGNGGTIDIGGIDISLKGAILDASGTEGGGRIRVGGAYQGGDFGAASTARTTSVDEGTLLTANAINMGDGGEVVVWSDGTTLFDGTIEVKGGQNGGDGGLAETSGADRLWVGSNAYVDALAPLGAVGDWLLDPKTVTIADGGTATLAQIADAGDTTSDLTIDASALNGAAANVSIVATETITFDEAVAMTNAGVGVSATAGNLIAVNTSVSTNNGDITLISDQIAIGAAINAGAGGVTVQRSTDGVVSLGDYNGGLHISQAEIALISAATLNVGGATEATNKITSLLVDSIDTTAGAIDGLVSLYALADDNADVEINGNNTFNALYAEASDRVGQNAEGAVVSTLALNDGPGALALADRTLTFVANARGNNDEIEIDGEIDTNGGAATFRVLNGGTFQIEDGTDTVTTDGGDVSVEADLVDINTADVADLAIDAGAGTVTFTRNSTGTISIGTASGQTQISQGELNNISAGTLVFGGTSSTTGINVGGTVTTTGGQVYGKAVSLAANTVLTSAGDISFNDTLDGGFGLAVNTAGVTRFTGKVGGTTALASLTTDAGGTTEVNGGLAATSSSQTYNDLVSVAGTVFAATGPGADLTFNAGVTTTLPDNDVWFLAADDITVGGDIQWNGTGNVSLVAGWNAATDGSTGWTLGDTTANDALLATTGNYGTGTGDISIGTGAQTTGVSVGSRSGTTTVLARDLVLSGSNTTDDSHAQLGFHGAATGDLAITLAGGLTAIGGAAQRSHAQVGHGSNSSIFAHSGNLVVTAAGDVSLIGGVGNASQAQLGHGGVNGTGTAMGNISAIVGGLTTMTANTGGYWFGHATNGAISNANVALVTNGLSVTGGDFASMIRNDLTGGDVLIANRIAQIDDPAFPAPAVLTDDIVYSGIGLADEVMTDHSLTLAATGEINFDHGLQIDGTGNINLVSGWDGTTGLDLTSFPALDTATIETAGAFGSSTGPFGDNGDVNIGDGQQTKSIYVGTRLGNVHVLAHDLEVRGSDDDFNRARLGANIGGNGSADSDIRIVVMDDVIVQGGDGVSSSAGIGHRLNDGSGALNGDITIIGDTAAHDNEVIVAGGDGEYAFAQIGHENAGGSTSGIISIAGEDVYVGTNHGSYAGGDGSTSQIGHYSDGFVGEASGDVTINASGQVVVTGGDRDGTFSVIGHEASIAEGDITLNVDGDMFVDGGIDDVTDAQVGHFAQISADGRISVNVGGDLFVRAGYSHDNAPAYIGHLGDGDLSGDIGIMVDGNLDLFGGFGDGSYGLIGHGDTEGYYFGARRGDIKVIVGGEATIMDGAGLNSEAWVGHFTGSSVPGAITDSNVLLQAFGFDRTNASTVAAGSLGAFNKNILLGNIPNGDFTLIATGTGLKLQDPVYNSPFQLLVSVNNDLVLANGATFTNTGTGDIILAAGGDFHNDTGSLTPVSTGGRWMIYSTRPDNNRNDIEITNWDFLRYSTPFDINNPIPASFAAGNGLIYSVTPVASSVASDETTFYGQVPTPTITQTVTVNGVNVDAAQFVLFFDLSNPGFSYGGNVLFNGNGNPVIGYYQDGLVPNGLITSHYGVITNIIEGDLTVVGTPVAPPATDTRHAVSQVVFAPCSPSEDDLRLTSNDRNTGQICTLLPTETD